MATSGKRGKQYGLIIRNQKSVQKTAHVSNVFGDSSDEEDVRSEVNASLAREGRRKLEAKATRELLQTAISEDPSVFEYDSVYDNIHQHKQSKTRSNTDKSRKPRYIHALLQAAEERKREQDIMFERKVQKERDAEGDMFADKEAFMTSAYREEMKRRAAMEERLRREAEQEKANDVTKQADMSRFYQHLLSQQSHHHSPATPGASSTMTTQRPSEQDKNRHMLDSHVADCITDADRITDPDHVIDSKSSLQSSEQEEEEKKDELLVDDRQQYGQQPPPRTNSHTDDDDDVPTDVSRQAQRRIAFAKRSTEATVLSARDRYLARKKAKISEPVVVVSDDDDIA